MNNVCHFDLSHWMRNVLKCYMDFSFHFVTFEMTCDVHITYLNWKNNLFYNLWLIMLEKIKTILFQKYAKTDSRWIFLSSFGENNQILDSTWVVYADKSLEDILDTIYHWVIEKRQWIKFVVLDVVTEYREIMDLSEMQDLSVKDYGIIVVEDNKSWAILPNTKWVTDLSQCIQLIESKNWLSWDAKIVVFQTDRIVVS